MNEIVITYKCYNCSNIIHLHEIYEHEEKVYLVMDYIKGGDLMERLLNNEGFSIN